jgi:hypothetical protein
LFDLHGRSQLWCLILYFVLSLFLHELETNYNSLCSLQNLIHFMRGYGCLCSKYYLFSFFCFESVEEGSWMHCPTWIQLKLNVNSFSIFALYLLVFLK